MRTAALAMVALGACGVQAQEAPVLSFSTFATLGIVRSSEDRATFTSTIFKPDGAGYGHAWSADVDTVLAAQLSAAFGSDLTAVVQVVSELNYDNTYAPHIEWANVRYRITPELAIRAGRTVLPAFLLSETAKIGYIYPWARPPTEVYQLLPVTSSDGVDVAYQVRAGDWSHTLQANAGHNELRLARAVGRAIADDAWGVTYTAESGAWILRATVKRTRLSITSVRPLFDALRQFGPQGTALAEKYGAEGKRFDVFGAGVSYDPGNWFFTSELGRLDAHSFIGRRSAWYASAGYRHGAFTPFVTFARARADNLDDPGLDLTGLPPQAAQPGAALNAALNATLRSKVVQDTLTVGTRWELSRNAALKAQYAYTRVGAGSNGTLTNIQPGFATGGRFQVFSAQLAFVY